MEKDDGSVVLVGEASGSTKAMLKQARKFDTGKPPMSLLPFTALREIARVLDMGKAKYGAHNWRKGMDWSRVADAATRHLGEWIDGEDKDPESGLSHLAHAACNLVFLITYEKIGIGKDDRYKKDDSIDELEIKELSQDST